MGSMACAVLMGHTPYQQWVVYRKRHLIILTSRTDGAAYALGKRVATILARDLPASKARVTRAPYMERVGSLLSTKQLDVARLSRAAAVALLNAQPPFVDYGPVPLRLLVDLASYVLVCRDDFPASHAYLVAKTLSTHRAALTASAASATTDADIQAAIPVHPGAFAYIKGLPQPEAKDQ